MDLASKYRPKTLEDVTEQGAVVSILRNICNSKELVNRNFLFIGPAGTGKTTLSRVLGNTLNNGEGDIIEVDAASYSGVESMRELVKQMRSYPLKGEYKVFILDEVHAFSANAWQAALKVLEEPPARTVTCLCTTNPEKIPATILSRVQTFQLSKISLKGIYARLIHILESEGYTKDTGEYSYTEEAVLFLAKLSQGGMRDGITLLTKVLAYSNKVDISSVTEALSLPNYNDYFNLLNAVVRKDNKTIVEIVDEVYNCGVNFIEWFSGFHSFVCNIIKYICLKDISKTMIPSLYESNISKYGEAHLLICLKWSKRLLEMIKDLKTTQYLQETAITFLCSR